MARPVVLSYVYIIMNLLRSKRAPCALCGGSFAEALRRNGLRPGDAPCGPAPPGAGGDAKIRAKRLKNLILDSARARRHLGHPQEQAWWTSTRAGAGVGSRVRTPMEYERQQVPARSALPGASGRAVADASHGSDSPEQSIDDRAPACSPLRYRRPSTSACHTSTS